MCCKQFSSTTLGFSVALLSKRLSTASFTPRIASGGGTPGQILAVMRSSAACITCPVELLLAPISRAREKGST
ncbi:hypothetical protein FOQG_14720 [Fusarium oxysporum f. sp. raphani 54005]|uniref:Uncharacterized protein n=1 Tax=Fusarium oxysporum f. sp. raphani 54005 TaxID=1089458 RepID=X0BG48_FUSOX|nr:hypothetical protein FOQG_14720 [Fusarium oxysporum f. sp. raphani 54005]